MTSCLSSPVGPTSLFEELPPELRNRIFKYAVTKPQLGGARYTRTLIPTVHSRTEDIKTTYGVLTDYFTICRGLQGNALDNYALFMHIEIEKDISSKFHLLRPENLLLASSSEQKLQKVRHFTLGIDSNFRSALDDTSQEMRETAAARLTEKFVIGELECLLNFASPLYTLSLDGVPPYETLVKRFCSLLRSFRERNNKSLSIDIDNPTWPEDCWNDILSSLQKPEAGKIEAEIKRFQGYQRRIASGFTTL